MNEDPISQTVDWAIGIVRDLAAIDTDFPCHCMWCGDKSHDDECFWDTMMARHEEAREWVEKHPTKASP